MKIETLGHPATSNHAAHSPILGGAMRFERRGGMYGACCLALAASTVSIPAAAQDLGDAVDYAKEHFNRGAGRPYESALKDRSRNDAMGMLSSRDVVLGKPLEAYDCLDSAIDTMPIMRSSSKEKASLRYCLIHRFDRDSLPGFRTLGDARLDETAVRPIVESMAARYEVPAVILNTIIGLSSGFRPHAVSDAGHVGLMQLRPDLLVDQGIEFGDLMDPRENIRAGAAYYRALVFEHGSLRKALLAYPDGPGDMTYKSRVKRWFVNFTMQMYLGANRKFPYKLGAENMTFVWTWLE